jgi:hypothetical protein
VSEHAKIIASQKLCCFVTRLWTDCFDTNHCVCVRRPHSGIEFINLGSFQIGCILLSGLFFYDVFWVFLSKPLIGSNVMVTVAKSFKGPIKFLFKKPGCDVRNAPPSCSYNSQCLSYCQQSKDSACTRCLALLAFLTGKGSCVCCGFAAR